MCTISWTMVCSSMVFVASLFWHSMMPNTGENPPDLVSSHGMHWKSSLVMVLSIFLSWSTMNLTGGLFFSKLSLQTSHWLHWYSSRSTSRRFLNSCFSDSVMPSPVMYCNDLVHFSNFFISLRDTGGASLFSVGFDMVEPRLNEEKKSRKKNLFLISASARYLCSPCNTRANGASMPQTIIAVSRWK